MQTASLRKVRDLGLALPPAPGRPLHLSAASGLVRVGAFIYVVADDELHLGVFRDGVAEPGHLIRLFEGELPDQKRARKASKPDLEALAMLPPHGSCPHGALLAVGSGSKPNRRLGSVIALDASGAARQPPRVVDLAPMLLPLGGTFPALNIEGATVRGDDFLLVQRGNAKRSANALIRYPLAALLDGLHSAAVPAIEPSEIKHFDLGAVDGTLLTFTDASALPDGRTVFTAVAEDTENTYDDGPCKGAAIGMIDAKGALSWMRALDPPLKVEGVDARIENGVIRLLLVTDADDAAVAAGLFETTIA